MTAPAYDRGPVLVTGGSGFIGLHLVSALLARGATVINLDLKPPELEAHRPLWVQGDMADAGAVRAALAQTRPALIYNLAAQASLSAGADALAVNPRGLTNLLNAIGGAGQDPLLVHASTQLVAGSGSGRFDPLALQPYGPYGESKAECERVLRAAPQSSRWTIVRPTTVWGPHHPTFAHGMWRYIDRRLYLQPGGKDVLRSYGYVENCVYQLMRIAEIDPSRVERQTFYVGDEPVLSGLWLDAFSRALTGRPVRRVPRTALFAAAVAGEISGRLGGPSPINLGRFHRMTHAYPTPMESTFAVLGRGPISLEEGVARSVAWMRSGGADEYAGTTGSTAE